MHAAFTFGNGMRVCGLGVLFIPLLLTLLFPSLVAMSGHSSRPLSCRILLPTGLKLDMHMREEGFQVAVELNQKNGLLYGGNRFNCGTWMDKMVGLLPLWY